MQQDLIIGLTLLLGGFITFFVAIKSRRQIIQHYSEVKLWSWVVVSLTHQAKISVHAMTNFALNHNGHIRLAKQTDKGGEFYLTEIVTGEISLDAGKPVRLNIESQHPNIPVVVLVRWKDGFFKVVRSMSIVLMILGIIRILF